MISYVHLEAVVAGKQPALLADAFVFGFDITLAVAGTAGGAVADGYLAADVLLFAFVDGAVLQAFDVQVGGIEGDAAAADLCAFDDGIAAAADYGLAVGVADTAVAPGGVFAVAVAFAVIAAGGNTEDDTAFAVADGNTGIPAAAAVFTLLAVVLFGCLQGDAVVGD